MDRASAVSVRQFESFMDPPFKRGRQDTAMLSAFRLALEMAQCRLLLKAGRLVPNAPRFAFPPTGARATRIPAAMVAAAIATATSPRALKRGVHTDYVDHLALIASCREEQAARVVVLNLLRADSIDAQLFDDFPIAHHRHARAEKADHREVVAHED